MILELYIGTSKLKNFLKNGEGEIQYSGFNLRFDGGKLLVDNKYSILIGKDITVPSGKYIPIYDEIAYSLSKKIKFDPITNPFPETFSEGNRGIIKFQEYFFYYDGPVINLIYDVDNIVTDLIQLKREETEINLEYFYVDAFILEFKSKSDFVESKYRGSILLPVITDFAKNAGFDRITLEDESNATPCYIFTKGKTYYQDKGFTMDDEEENKTIKLLHKLEYKYLPEYNLGDPPKGNCYGTTVSFYEKLFNFIKSKAPLIIDNITVTADMIGNCIGRMHFIDL